MKKKKQRKLKILELECPNDCFCFEWGREPVRSERDELLGYTAPIYGKYDYDKAGPAVRYPIRKCQLCGKEYIDAPAMASIR